jgi:hypothetical protein
MRPATVQQLAEPFARAMAHKSRALATLRLTSRQAAALRRSMSDDVRKFHDAAIPSLLPYEISEAAALAAETYGIDLASLSYAVQPAVDPGRGVLHYEHMDTISSIVAKALAAERVEEIIALLCTSRVAWITKAENGELARLGYSSNRDDPDAAYAEAGIRLIHRTSEAAGSEGGLAASEVVYVRSASSPQQGENSP